MKNLITKTALFTSLLLAAGTSNAQGWTGTTSGDVLYPVNSILGISPMSIGIGLNNPTAQLHTNGSVRLEGLTIGADNYVVTADAAGNLSLKNVSDIDGDHWDLAGNVVSATQFIGSTNNEDFRIRTSNIQRMVISATGQVGVGTATPIKIMDIRYSEGVAYSPTEWNRNGLFLYNNSDVLDEGQSSTIILAARGGVNDYMSRALISGVCTGQDEIDIAFQNEYAGSARVRETMRITSAGHVGINVAATDIDSYLHTSGGVRHENLPSGSGLNLVIDASGYVYVSNQKKSQDIEILEEKVEDLKQEIEELKKMIMTSSTSFNMGSSLNQNFPNPTTESSTIGYQIAGNFTKASIQFYNMNGALVKTAKLSSKRGQLMINSSDFQSGTYQYVLIVDGENIASKKMVIA